MNIRPIERPEHPIGLVRMVTHPMSADILLRGQLRYLAGNGFRVSVISAPGPELERAGTREGAEIFPVPLPDGSGPDANAHAIGRVAGILERLKPTIVQAGTSYMAWLGLQAARDVGVPVRIYVVNGLPLETAVGPQRDFCFEVERTATACAHEVFCVSHSLRERFVELGLDPEGKTRVLGDGSSNGVDVERFRPPMAGEVKALRRQLGLPAEAAIIGWVGRLTAIKGIRDLYTAFTGPVLERHPLAFLLLVGGLDSFAPIDQGLFQQLQSHPRIRVTGHVDEPGPYYRAMDLLALPSSREGFSNAALEGAASALAVVGYRATGLMDAVVSGRTGNLVPVGEWESLAESIIHYLSEQDLRRRQGAAGRQRALLLFPQERIWQLLRDALWQAVASRDDRAGD